MDAGSIRCRGNAHTFFRRNDFAAIKAPNLVTPSVNTRRCGYRDVMPDER